MAQLKSRALSTVLGYLSVAGLGFIWLVDLAPLRWNLRYPGGALSGILTMIGCIVLSSLAGRWGSRDWYFVTAIASLTFAYIGFFKPSAYWF